MKSRFFLMFTIVIVLITSCKQSEYSGFEKADSGLFYNIHIDNGGEKANPGDFLTVEMIYTTNEDSLLFDSEGQTFPLQLEEPVFAGDINEALSLLGRGDSATFVIRADSFLIRNAKISLLPDFVDDKSKMIFYVKIHNIQTLEELELEEKALQVAAEQKESQAIEDYLAANNLALEPTSTGMYFILNKKGNGRKAEAGKSVTVHFTGMYLDGTKFDSSYDRNKPVEFTLGYGQVITGWDEGIALMKVGDEATFIIPSYLGYREGRGQIPPYTPLLFDVKLIDVK